MSACYFLAACAAERPPLTFIEEIRALRKTELMQDLHIHDIVVKHLPIGSGKDVVSEFCATHGMKIHVVVPKHNPETAKQEETIRCSRHLAARQRFWHFLKQGHLVIGDDDMLLSFDLRDGRLTRTTGYVRMQHF